MNLIGYKNLPVEIKNQIVQVVEIWKKYLGDELIGIYLHGSIVLNAFCPDSGDIDILIVVKNSISCEIKLSVAEEIISVDKKPRPLEMSAIKLSDAQNWKNGGNCVFHYSDYWTERYLKRFENPSAELYVVDNEFPDLDVTSYIKLINECGIVLFGKQIDEVFCEISDEDFWCAITADIDDYKFDNYEPRYFTSNIIILGRILSFKVTKKILSKYEAALWMIDYVPSELKYIPEAAKKIWFEGADKNENRNESLEFPPTDLEKLRNFLIDKIKTCNITL